MYCEKLKNIFQHEDSKNYDIDIIKIKKLDLFIKEKTTSLERDKINPIKFSIEMGVNERTSIMLFVIGTKCKLFDLRAYVNCSCGEQYEVHNLNEKIDCYCGNNIIPAEERESVFLYFRLNCPPVDCDWLGIKEYQVDYLDGDVLGKRLVSLAEVDGTIGTGKVDSLINQRDIKYKKYLGCLSSEFGV